MGYPPQGVGLEVLTTTQAALAAAQAADTNAQAANAALQVPSIDNILNTTINQILGNKSDNHSAATLFAYIHDAWEGNHHEQKVYPTLANSVQVTADAAAWTLGNYAEIVAANVITGEFHIHHICILGASANGEYELVLYAGTTEIARVTFTRTDKKDDVEGLDIIAPHCAANAQIQAKLASGNLVADTAKFKIWYHLHS